MAVFAVAAARAWPETTTVRLWSVPSICRSCVRMGAVHDVQVNAIPRMAVRLTNRSTAAMGHVSPWAWRVTPRSLRARCHPTSSARTVRVCVRLTNARPTATAVLGRLAATTKHVTARVRVETTSAQRTDQRLKGTTMRARPRSLTSVPMATVPSPSSCALISLWCSPSTLALHLPRSCARMARVCSLARNAQCCIRVDSGAPPRAATTAHVVTVPKTTSALARTRVPRATAAASTLAAV